MLFNPKKEDFSFLDLKSREIMNKTIIFFEEKGKKRLKKEYHERTWYNDFIEFLRKEKIFFHLLTPSTYGSKECRWDTFRNMFFNEILSFYSLAHWYAWQVTILGLGPIWMSKNDHVKKNTANLLENGGIFAFGLSEKEHGADLYSSDMMLTPLEGDQYRADGSKYYIGNGNEAALVSTFGKNSYTDEYVFFVVSSKHPDYNCVQNVVNSQMYVSEYTLDGYPISNKDILSSGRSAWDSALNTINIGKYNLGWASIGICTHSFFEAINHASNRSLFGKNVTDFSHIRQLFVEAYTRLLAMRMFSMRAADYMRNASQSDRRYLLYNPIVKMRVTTQGEKTINLLWDIIAAKGFEKDTYFEMAAADIRALPKLEGTVHVNMALIVKFMFNYFFNSTSFPKVPVSMEPINDDFLFNQGPTKGLKNILFHDYKAVYNMIDSPNLAIFKEQIEVLASFLLMEPPNSEQTRDIDFLLTLGELFTSVVYGQLLIEKILVSEIEEELIDQIFDFMIKDFSKFALQLYSKDLTTNAQMNLCLKMIKKPILDSTRFNLVWEKYVQSLKESYNMSN